MPMGGSMHLMSGIMQKLNMSTGSQSPVLILKAIKSAEEDEYWYSKFNTDTKSY